MTEETTSMNETRGKLKLSGIYRRWLTSSPILIMTILLLVFLAVFIIGRYYYRSAASSAVHTMYSNSVETFFASESEITSFEEAAREYVETFEDKDIMDVWVIDPSGKVVVSSSGFPVAEQKIPDFEAALKSESGTADYSGRNFYGEPVMAVTHILHKGDSTLGAVRYVVSLKQTNREILRILFALLIVFLAIALIMIVSGLTFIDSIVEPIRKINDVTKRIAGGDMSARVEPQQYHDEISELTENINFMAEELGSTDKMKNDFISTVSHEMKTPLTAIKGWAETLQSVGGSDPGLTERGLEVIIEESSRLTGVVEDLLDLSKIAGGRMTLKYEKIDILAELDDTIYVFKDRSMREGIELNYNAPHVPAPAEGDPNRINQVFVNILDNAFKYTEQGGKITVFAEVIPPETEDGSKSTLRVFVEDTGCGISKEELPKVRKKFYKSNISSRGSGIGLAVVDEIVKMHGGTMDIKSEVGVGTCVILSFPVDYVPVEEPELKLEIHEIEMETKAIEQENT